MKSKGLQKHPSIDTGPKLRWNRVSSGARMSVKCKRGGSAERNQRQSPLASPPAVKTSPRAENTPRGDAA